MPHEGHGFVVVMEGNRIPELNGTPTLSADEYLEGAAAALSPDLAVVNLCRSYQYLSKGYYVSLLADARRQRVFPTSKAIEEARNTTTSLRALRAAGVPVADARVARELRRAAARGAVPSPLPALAVATALGAPVTGGGAVAPFDEETAAPVAPDAPACGSAEAWCVFGQTVDARFQKQCEAVFRTYSFPLLRVRFHRDGGEWKAAHVAPIALHQLDPGELQLLSRELARPRFLSPAPAAPATTRRIACLWDASDPFAASDRKALDRFERVAAAMGISFERIGAEDLPCLAEYDALFIRSVTAIDHVSFTFAQMAESLRIPVIDDPQSILRCTNKVYLQELFERHGIPTPRTAIISRRRSVDVARDMGFPLIVKMPDGSFSQSVKKADDFSHFDAIVQDMFRRSPLLIVQEFTPTEFDWRIGVLENRVLFACKYHMVAGHWQIVTTSAAGEPEYGRVEAVRIDDVPPDVLRLALASAALVGDGLYGVDIKDMPGGPAVIEVNDNPSIHVDCEDEIEGDRLYGAVLEALARRIQKSFERERL
jgi:glutathione synthase/RimK-type ligase-like ATP-grasp enzyme